VPVNSSATTNIPAPTIQFIQCVMLILLYGHNPHEPALKLKRSYQGAAVDYRSTFTS
jgi:hypothetical protein